MLVRCWFDAGSTLRQLLILVRRLLYSYEAPGFPIRTGNEEQGSTYLLYRPIG